MAEKTPLLFSMRKTRQAVYQSDAPKKKVVATFAVYYALKEKEEETKTRERAIEAILQDAKKLNW